MIGTSFQSAGWLALWGVAQEGLLIVLSLLNLASQACLKTNLMIRPTAIGAVVTLLLLFILLPYKPLMEGPSQLCRDLVLVCLL